jgi:hypothetical protein
MSHFLFIAGAFRERSSLESAQLQLSHELWGIRTSLIRDNLERFLTAESCGLVYVLKVGICAGFTIISRRHAFEELSEFVRDELRSEAAYGFVRIANVQTWSSIPDDSLALLRRVLNIDDSAELTRRLNLGMHRLSQAEYDALIHAVHQASQGAKGV